MGIVVVALLAANAGGPPETTIRSTLRRTRSAARPESRSNFPSANRYSKVIFFPSIHPSLPISCRNASKRTAIPEAVLDSRKPMRGTLLVRVGKRNICQKKSCQQPESESLLHVLFLALCLTHFASFHLITLSALYSKDCGMVRLICCAVFRLITSSNFVGCSTGKSAGLAPFRILSTKYATRR